jgi:hypothetical protein
LGGWTLPAWAADGDATHKDAADAAAGKPLLPDFGLKPLGKLKPRATREIAASTLSVGFETLDRQCFDPEKTYPYMAQLGAKWARCQTGWARTEQEKGKYDFAWLDSVVDSLRALGVQPWFNLGYGNPLYTSEADATAVGWAPVFTEEASEGWLNYTKAIAEHFAGRVKHWEIWNEPNCPSFWKPGKRDAKSYAELIKMTAPVIRQHVPDAVIIGGAFAGIPLPFIEKCLEAGLGDSVDKISYHPYRALPEKGYHKDLFALHELMQKYTQGRVKLWQGENGCPSQPGGMGALKDLPWTEARQAKWLLRRMLGDLHLGLELTSYFLIVDLVGYRGGTNYKGILNGTTYTPKPAFFAYQNLCSLFDAETKPIGPALNAASVKASALKDAASKDAAMKFEGDETDKIVTAVFERRGVPLYAYWTPADLLEDFSPRKVQAAIPMAAQPSIQEPVLFSLLTGEYFALQGKLEGGELRFQNLPLLEHPLIVTDRKVVAG